MKYLPFDQSLLKKAAFWADHEGRKRRKQRSGWGTLPDDDGEEERQHQNGLRQKLRAIVGCEHTLSFLLDFVDEKTSCAQLGALLVRNRSTAWKKVQGIIAQARKRALLAEAIVAALHQDGDCTISPHTAQPIIDRDTWAVSLLGFEARFPHRPTFEDCCAYILRHETLLFGRDPLYLDGRFDDRADEYCLNVTKFFPDKANAIAFARAHQQRAITNLRTLQTFWLDEDERKAA